MPVKSKSKYKKKKKPKKLTYKTKWKRWRLKIYRRDNFMCQMCGRRARIEPHHIIRKADHPELTFVVRNGITLCATQGKHKGCHNTVTGSEKDWAPLFTMMNKKELTIDKLDNFIQSLPAKIKNDLAKTKKIEALDWLFNRIKKLEKLNAHIGK